MRRIAFACVLAAAAGEACAQPVAVALDMDCALPGIQPSIEVPLGTTRVPCLSVYIYDPAGGRQLLSIGYIGALDRGIALGHAPSNQHQGQVVSITGIAGTPVNPANTGAVFPAMQHGFAGPEVQYIEYNAAQPAPIRPSPGPAVFTAEVRLTGTARGDVYAIALMDLVTVWRAGTGGAFTTAADRMLDTGGDVVPDLTPGLQGPDPDTPVPVPPGAYPVDYIDGVTGPASIIVPACYANCDHSTTPPALNVADFTCYLQRFAAGELYANCDASTQPPVLNVADFTCFIQRFSEGCP